MKHKPAMTIHAVPQGSGGLTAECGEALGPGHTGQNRPLRPALGWHVCAACEGER